MAGTNNDEKTLPTTYFRTPPFQPEDPTEPYTATENDSSGRINVAAHPELGDAKASAQPPLLGSRPLSSTGHDVYLGSYRRPRSVKASASAPNTPRGSVVQSSHGSKSHVPLAHLLDQLDAEQETYGVEEHRDGFFDAIFLSTRSIGMPDHLDLQSDNDEQGPDLFTTIIPRNCESIRYFVRRITTTRAGIKLIKTCLPFFIAYFVCLIPAARDWLGRYNFVMPLSVILNHPGRPIGAQVDGALLTITGTVAGLGWAALALYVSTSTQVARSGYGGVLAAFLITFTALISYLRCFLIRFYQFVICAGVAVVYATLADTSEEVSWRKFFDYGIPFVLGQALSLLVCLTVFPDAGSRALAIEFHRSFSAIHMALQLPRQDEAVCRRDLASSFVSLSDAARDFTIDFSITRFYPEDVRALRNLGQAAIRSCMALESSSALAEMEKIASNAGRNGSKRQETVANGNAELDTQTTYQTIVAISTVLAKPVRALVTTSMNAIACADEVILIISGYRQFIEPVEIPESDLATNISTLSTALKTFDEADEALLSTENLPLDYAENPELVNVLVFVHSVRQVAASVQTLSSKMLEMQRRDMSIHFNTPSYPIAKALNRTNAQVRHDRGGLTVGFYFRTKRQLERTMQDLQSRVYVPLPEQHFNGVNVTAHDFQTPSECMYKDEKVYLESRTSSDNENKTTRYKIWWVLHELQGFETKFALKVTVVTTLLSIPAWLPQSRDWWNQNEAWFAIVMVWMMMHPRVGGNVQDLFTRDLTAAIGAIWAGFSYAADNGNPYVMAVFAVVLMVPMLYRFTQSTHPRSGLAGCIAFTVISLSAYTDNINAIGIVHLTWTRGVACIVGITAAVIGNWVIWPFIARHELRKSVSTMLLHLAILYRGVVSKYVYYTTEGMPAAKDIERSEMLEGRLREAFVRIRQLLDLTNHEIRLRAPFDPKPYRALIETCEDFFNDLIKIRQFSLYFQPVLGQSDTASNVALLSYRRDAVASILMVMYTLAGALKTGRPLPRYLPSAAAARKRLLDRMSQVYGTEDGGDGTANKKRTWADVYQFAYSKALTDIVEQLNQMQQTTKLITGEVGFDHDEGESFD